MNVVGPLFLATCVALSAGMFAPEHYTWRRRVAFALGVAGLAVIVCVFETT